MSVCIIITLPNIERNEPPKRTSKGLFRAGPGRLHFAVGLFRGPSAVRNRCDEIAHGQTFGLQHNCPKVKRKEA